MPPIKLDPEDGHFAGIWNACQPAANMSFERDLALFRAIRYLHQNFIGGAIVGIGTRQDSSTAVAMRTLQHFGVDRRQILLIGSQTGTSAELVLEEPGEVAFVAAGSDEVRDPIAVTGYDPALITYLDASEPVANSPQDPIALLHLSTNTYESTWIALNRFYPCLASGGILLIDNFGSSDGTRRAVDEYFDGLRRAGQILPLLNLISGGGGVAVRPAPAPIQAIERRDYYAPGLTRSGLLAKFNTLVARDPRSVDWPYLRKNAPHVWRTDARSIRLPDTGVLSVEEAELLFNNALPFCGQRGLEIGCHYGWSTAHLLTAGLQLDVVDPALQFCDQRDDVESSLAQVESTGSFHLWPAFSPAILPAIRSTQLAPWSFVLVDGYHEGDTPRQDAAEVARHCSDSACVLFHDLTSPFVAAGLKHFAELGWSTGLYNTMQIMGIAWRGNAQPVKHVADPQMPPIDHVHLVEFDVLSS